MFAFGQPSEMFGDFSINRLIATNRFPRKLIFFLMGKWSIFVLEDATCSCSMLGKWHFHSALKNSALYLVIAMAGVLRALKSVCA
jgi:hypothetical protein